MNTKLTRKPPASSDRPRSTATRPEGWSSAGPRTDPMVPAQTTVPRARPLRSSGNISAAAYRAR